MTYNQDEYIKQYNHTAQIANTLRHSRYFLVQHPDYLLIYFLYLSNLFILTIFIFQHLVYFYRSFCQLMLADEHRLF